MVKDYQKYIEKLSPTSRVKLAFIIEKIKILDLEGLDCKKMSGFKNIFRARAGKFRIVFEKRAEEGCILKINTRGDIY